MCNFVELYDKITFVKYVHEMSCVCLIFFNFEEWNSLTKGVANDDLLVCHICEGCAPHSTKFNNDHGAAARYVCKAIEEEDKEGEVYFLLCFFVSKYPRILPAVGGKISCSFVSATQSPLQVEIRKTILVTF